MRQWLVHAYANGVIALQFAKVRVNRIAQTCTKWKGFAVHIANDCGDLREIANGTNNVLKGDGKRYPSYVQHVCSIGYRLTGGHEFRHCLSTGHWSGQHPECRRVLPNRVLLTLDNNCLLL